MARNDLFSMQRRHTNTAMTAPEPEWRENLRDLGLMLSGIWQDVRGDLADSFSDYVKWLTAGLRRAFSQRAE
ncbi:hypothetical protein [Pelagibacterium sediminicola]|uniref:hypothetical protein n=1 Tax=Pelagibacterium sediminicola TaxID=2248761 RepID=UPI000E314C8C|nr:hypothetical protein [Pelagibacterium sediminicola]